MFLLAQIDTFFQGYVTEYRIFKSFGTEIAKSEGRVADLWNPVSRGPSRGAPGLGCIISFGEPRNFSVFFESLVLKALHRAVRPVTLRKTTFCSVALRKMSIYPVASRKNKSLHRRFEKNYDLHRNSRKNDTHGPVCGVALGNATVCSYAGKYINLHRALGKRKIPTVASRKSNAWRPLPLGVGLLWQPPAPPAIPVASLISISITKWDHSGPASSLGAVNSEVTANCSDFKFRLNILEIWCATL